MKALLIIVSLAFALAGCTLLGQGEDQSGGIDRITNLPLDVAKRVTDPVFTRAVEDAQTTLAWIDKDERLSPTQKADASRCPQSVLQLNELRQALLNGNGVQGFKGVIYFATLRKYGGDPREQFSNAVEDVGSACAGLILQDSDLVLKFLAP